MLDDQDQNQTIKTADEQPEEKPQPSAPESAEEANAASEDVEEKIEPETEASAQDQAPSEEPSKPEAVPFLMESQEQHDEKVALEEEIKQDDTSSPKVDQIATDDPAKWYIIHTYSGHENKVSKSIKQRVQSLGFEKRIFDVIVPTRNTIKVSGGKKETVKEKIFPGYVLVKMVLDDESWLLVRTTQGVTAFIGAGNKPTPISNQEVEAIQKFMNEEEPLYKATFSVGEAVKIVDGPFADFLGTIDNIDEARGKLKVLVSIFGRETPVELDFLQVNKL